MQVGPDHWAWRGGSQEYYGPSWRAAKRATRKRDGVCQKCGISSKELGHALDVHHLVSFRSFGVERHEEANQLDNLIALCRTCHAFTEWGGNRRIPLRIDL
ncbi:MAG: HNH endonuclease [Dehalococcoidia bacterium]